MKKVLVLGAGGMAGHMISAWLAGTGRYEVLNAARNVKFGDGCLDFDAYDRQSVGKLLKDASPDIVVNCAGILVQASDKHKDDAAYVNAFFPHMLERIAGVYGFRIIHLSTDCVFSGRRGNYAEGDLCGADDFYGKSKALGEIENGRDLSMRMSIIGPEIRNSGAGLMHWYLTSRGRVKGYYSAIWNGITTLELAKAVDRAIQTELKGIYHLIPPCKISKGELLVMMRGIWGDLCPEVDPIAKPVFDKTLINTRKDFDFQVKDYPVMLAELYDWMRAHGNLYPHYSVFL